MSKLFDVMGYFDSARPPAEAILRRKNANKVEVFSAKRIITLIETAKEQYSVTGKFPFSQYFEIGGISLFLALDISDEWEKYI